MIRRPLFVLACGLATLETVAHPFVASLGEERTSDQRINFAQSFNALGAVVGPLIGGQFILGGSHSLASVQLLYIIIGCVITAVAVSFALVKVPVLRDFHSPSAEKDAYAVPTDISAIVPAKKLLQQRHFIWAAVAQFFNVAAQGGTWAFFINYGHEKMGFTDKTASFYFSLSMVMMMVGRFVGTYIMRFVAPNKLLAAFAFGSIVMCVVVAQSWGWPSFIALLMINFFFSIMFPTIFSLGLKDLGPNTQQGSSFIVMGVVGGALFPYLMGKIANHDVAAAYYLPIVCYFVIFLFGARLYKVKH